MSLNTLFSLFLAGAPYPARFAPPVVTADGVYDLSWRVNCSTPVISYELEFRELPHGNWLSLNVPGWCILKSKSCWWTRLLDSVLCYCAFSSRDLGTNHTVFRPFSRYVL